MKEPCTCGHAERRHDLLGVCLTEGCWCGDFTPVKINCETCGQPIVRDTEHQTAHGYAHVHSGVQYCDDDSPGRRVATPPKGEE